MFWCRASQTGASLLHQTGQMGLVIPSTKISPLICLTDQLLPPAHLELPPKPSQLCGEPSSSWTPGRMSPGLSSVLLEPSTNQPKKPNPECIFISNIPYNNISHRTSLIIKVLPFFFSLQNIADLNYSRQNPPKPLSHS